MTVPIGVVATRTRDTFRFLLITLQVAQLCLARRLWRRCALRVRRDAKRAIALHPTQCIAHRLRTFPAIGRTFGERLFENFDE